MPNSPWGRVVSAGVVGLALVGHLWMLSSSGAHGSEADPSTAIGTVSAEEVPTSLSGCPTGMEACQVPMPTEPLAALLLAALLTAVLVLADVIEHDRAAPVSAPAQIERAPPQHPAVPSSVVLQV